MDNSLSVVIGLVFAMAMIGAIVNMVPKPQYTCPICGEKFFTYDELYNHFTSSHPSEPIEIIWE